jgi:hypothetical protein
MKFLMIYESDPHAPPPTPETFVRLGAYTAKMTASGAVILTGGVVRPSRGIKLKSQGGKVTVTDGPFAESKEVIDGYAVVNADSVEAAIALATEFMDIAGEGKGEILRIYDPPEIPAPK